MQWVDMLRDVDEGFNSASSTSRNANLYKHILVVLGVACAVVCVLLLVTLTVFCKTRRRYRRLTSGVGSVVYQSRLVSHDARGIDSFIFAKLAPRVLSLPLLLSNLTLFANTTIAQVFHERVLIYHVATIF